MTIKLTGHQYGKAETRVVRIVRDTVRHEITDLNVTTALRGDFGAAYLDGDQATVLPTDTQKNTAFAYAKEVGVDSIEGYGLALASHFVRDVEPVTSAQVDIEQYGWNRVRVDGAEHDHTWVRAGEEIRTARVTATSVDGELHTEVVGGLKDLVVLKSTGSEFKGFLKDSYTTLAETDDRIMATSLVATWRFATTDVAWDTVYAGVKAALLREFAVVHSRALQQTLWHMGKAVLEAYPEIAEISLAAPNKHHFLQDLGPFGLENPGEVFHAADRPYGLIEATIGRDPAGAQE